ncbi:MAG: CHAP domain-containing protein [Candidatus Geothermincolia bacterium]
MREIGGTIVMAALIALTALLVASCAGSSGPAPGAASAVSGIDEVALPGSEWQGVDIYRNDRPHSEPLNYKYGQKWQCVELVQRFFATKWGYPPIWPVRYGSQMFDRAPAGIERHPNGDRSSVPVWGDAIVFENRYDKGDMGHVCLVVGVKDGRIYTLNQNYLLRWKLPFDEGHHIVVPGYLKAVGWLHSPLNTDRFNVTW